MNELFNAEEYTYNSINEHWQDMPEYIQQKKEPYHKVIVRFENEKDLQEFSSLINQKITSKTKSIWHPKKSHWGLEKRFWKNEK